MTNEFTPAELARRDADRTRRYKEMLDFYHGSQWEGREKRNEKRLTFNYAKVFIDKGTSYLMSGNGLVADPVADTPAARSAAQAAETALGQVAEDNNLEQLDFDTEIDCAILGDACYKVTWDTGAKRVNVTAPDVHGIFAWRAGDDPSKVWRVASRYTLSREAAAGMHGVNARGKTVCVTEVWTARDFELWIDDARVERKANPYGFIPFVIYPNLREPKQFWGVSDLANIMAPQRELNRATSQLSRILELSGNPIAVLENVEESEDIAVAPGAVWNIPEDAKAYLLDLLQGGGASLHLDYINLLFRIMHDLSESPRAAFGSTERDLSAVAMEIELQPLLQKVRRKRIIRSAAYIRRGRMILKLLEKYALPRGGPAPVRPELVEGPAPPDKAGSFPNGFGGVRLNVVWGPVLPQDFTEQVANEKSLTQSGIHSRRKAMSELGIEDPEAEFARWLEEREAILKMDKGPKSSP